MALGSMHTFMPNLLQVVLCQHWLLVHFLEILGRRYFFVYLGVCDNSDDFVCDFGFIHR